MSKPSIKARQLAEEQLDLLLQEHCEEVAFEPTPAALSSLATRLQLFVNARDCGDDKPSQIRLDQQARQDYDLGSWDAPVYHS